MPEKATGALQCSGRHWPEDEPLAYPGGRGSQKKLGALHRLQYGSLPRSALTGQSGFPEDPWACRIGFKVEPFTAATLAAGTLHPKDSVVPAKIARRNKTQ
jgi:hypothetical protein